MYSLCMWLWINIYNTTTTLWGYAECAKKQTALTKLAKQKDYEIVSGGGGARGGEEGEGWEGSRGEGGNILFKLSKQSI